MALRDYCADRCLECIHKKHCSGSWCKDDCDSCKYKDECTNTYDPEEDRERWMDYYDDPV